MQERIWHAVYTKSRAEKKVALELDFCGIENYVPLYRKLRQWSDRKKWVETPLISGYVFVQINPTEYDKVLKIQGVVCFLKFDKRLATIPNNQIDSIKRMLRQTELPIKLNQGILQEGDKIEVIGGLLIGMKGILIKSKGKRRVAIQLQELNLSFEIEVPLNEIRKIN